MIVFCKADGTIIDVLPSPVYQGSNLSGSIYFVAPLSRSNAVTVAFKLPNGIYTPSLPLRGYEMTAVSELEGITDKLGKEYSVWEWQDGNAEVTQYAGLCMAQFSIYLPNGQLLTTSSTSFDVHAGTLPPLPDAPTDEIYELILRYIARLDDRTKNVPNLAATIQPVASNAFTYTTNNGVESAPIVLFGEGESAPIPYGAASTIAIPESGWQAQYVGTDIAHYTCTIAAAQHGQMRDDAKPSDLWVNADTADGADLLGYFPRYTVDASGNITITVNQPVAMNVRVWNGKSIVDTTARDLITAETTRAETEEQKLQDQINELVSGNVDEVARTLAREETKRAEAAEADLQQNINAEVNRATAAEESLQTNINDLTTQVSGLISVVAFTSTSWATTASSLYYLGAVNKAVTVPNGKRIIQVLDNNNSPRGTWQNNVIYANEAFAGVAIII